MASDGVLRLHTDGFTRGIATARYRGTRGISDHYMLVRPEGSVLNKEQVLEDLIEHKWLSTQ